MTTPGEASQPEDTQGDGPVGLADRNKPDGQGSPDTNQSKAESFSTPDAEAPESGSMSLGAGDPQLPRHGAQTRSQASPSGGVGDAAGVAVASSVAAEGTSEDLAPVDGHALRGGLD